MTAKRSITPLDRSPARNRGLNAVVIASCPNVRWKAQRRRPPRSSKLYRIPGSRPGSCRAAHRTRLQTAGSYAALQEAGGGSPGSGGAGSPSLPAVLVRLAGGSASWYTGTATALTPAAAPQLHLPSHPAAPPPLTRTLQARHQYRNLTIVTQIPKRLKQRQ